MGNQKPKEMVMTPDTRPLSLIIQHVKDIEWTLLAGRGGVWYRPKYVWKSDEERLKKCTALQLYKPEAIEPK